jgi:hypothetical protein
LLFERFLNPERLGGLPDIDIDICTRGRASVVAYLQSRYGIDSVAKLTTFKILHGKTALKDCGRAFGIGFNRLNELTANVPALVAGKAPGIAWIVANDPRLANLMEEDRRVNLAVQYASRIEGLVRETGVHASGIVISDIVDDKAKGRRFTSSLIDGARDLCELAKSLNVVKDVALEQARRDLEAAIGDHNADDLRENDTARAAVKAKVDTILGKMSW